MNENNEVTNDDLKVEDVPEIEEIPDVPLEVQDVSDSAQANENNNNIDTAILEENKEETPSEVNNSTKINDSTEEKSFEETKEEATKKSSEVKAEQEINVDATVLTNEEVKNVNSDMITAPQENVELPKIEAEVITPINESKSIEKSKEKKKKHPVKIIINIFIWIVVLGWAGILVFDFINVISEKEPMFCLEKSTEKTSDGTIDKCEGVGYNVYKYDYGSIKYIEFVPFWSKPKTLEQLQK